MEESILWEEKCENMGICKHWNENDGKVLKWD